jgi:ribosomal protein L12E/L44/L45/RPP1/RPP2
MRKGRSNPAFFMTMLCTAKKQFSSVHLGNVDEKEIVEVPDGIAQKMINHGLLEPYETKVIAQGPKEPAAASSPASQAAQASPKSSAKKSGNGGKKDAKNEQSSS